jgi:hypothetical protein
MHLNLYIYLDAMYRRSVYIIAYYNCNNNTVLILLSQINTIQTKQVKYYTVYKRNKVQLDTKKKHSL